MTGIELRQNVTKDITNASNDGARLSMACKIVGISIRTFQRWLQSNAPDMRTIIKKSHPKALTDEEKKQIISICVSDEYSDMTPNEIIPRLAEKGLYVASESAFYKVLRENKLLKYRENSKPPRKLNRPPELIADGPNQVWSWDITYLKTNVSGLYFYLYLFMDIWSRKIVGWSEELVESGEIASRLVEELCIANNIESIYLHSDNGGPMTCGTIKATFERLGVLPSYSRPRISNDNPFSESLFRTLKYRPSFPGKFNTVDDATQWVENFVNWYNKEHLHSGIKYVTPNERHLGLDVTILKKRHSTYQKAKKKNPLRWVGRTRNWEYQETVELNKIPEKISIKKIS